MKIATTLGKFPLHFGIPMLLPGLHSPHTNPVLEIQDQGDEVSPPIRGELPAVLSGNGHIKPTTATAGTWRCSYTNYRPLPPFLLPPQQPYRLASTLLCPLAPYVCLPWLLCPWPPIMEVRASPEVGSSVAPCTGGKCPLLELHCLTSLIELR